MQDQFNGQNTNPQPQSYPNPAQTPTPGAPQPGPMPQGPIPPQQIPQAPIAPNPNNKKPKTKIIIIIICSILVLAGVGVGIYFLTKDNGAKTPEGNNGGTSQTDDKNKEKTDEELQKEFEQAFKDAIEKAEKDDEESIKNANTQLGLSTALSGLNIALLKAEISGEGEIPESDLNDIKAFVISESSSNKWLSSYGSSVRASLDVDYRTNKDTMMITTDKECVKLETTLEESGYYKLSKYDFTNSPCEGGTSIKVTK